MSKIYKGHELLKEIEEGKIKNGTKFKSCNEIIELRGDCFWYENSYEEVGNSVFIENDFELIENEIDIQDIEEYQTTYTERCIDKEVRDYINKKILPAIKQLDNKISNLQSI